MIHLLEMVGPYTSALITLTVKNGAVGKARVVGREIEFHVHHENGFSTNVNFPTTRI